MAMLLVGCGPMFPSPSTTQSTVLHGRLIVIGPTQRWQAMFDMKADSPAQGWLRIVHAASGHITELRWTGARMQWRDNQATLARWRSLTADDLARHGIMLKPGELAAFLLGNPPAGFQRQQTGHWLIRRGKSRIRVRRVGRRLTVTDLSHGRRAIVILP